MLKYVPFGDVTLDKTEGLKARIPLASIQDAGWIESTRGMKSLRTRWRKVVKRLFDVALAASGLALGLPGLPLLALAIKIDSPGPVFYRQDRVGRGEKPFFLFKYRSMFADAEDGAAVWAEENDRRVTAVGRFLRRFHLDEWPQLWNVLKGDMSIVGPRPERPEFVRELKRRIPHYRDRFAAKPGLTGWAQIRYKYTSTFEDAQVKLEYDLYYISRWSLSLDILILARTLGVVLRGDVRQ